MKLAAFDKFNGFMEIFMGSETQESLPLREENFEYYGIIPTILRQFSNFGLSILLGETASVCFL